jgi:signal transduction histidine kinase
LRSGVGIGREIVMRTQEDELQKALVLGKVGAEDWRVRKDGTQFWANYATTPVYNTHGELQGFAYITRDLTERKQAETDLRKAVEELSRSNLDLEQFAYVASHDLQEPLCAVAGCVQVLKKRYQGRLNNRADELIAHTVDGVRRMQTLIDDLLSYSRVGTQGRAFEPCACNAAMNQAVANLEAAIAEASAVVTHDQLPIVEADAAQLTQLFQNLVSNAIKFKSQQSPTIHVAVRRDEDHWFFSVKDNGIGIQPEYFERIFVIFQRLHTRTDYHGTGIGLAICKKIVERHGGRIFVEAMRLVEKHEGGIDLLVTDVVMPGMGGPDLAAALRPRLSQMKVLFSSGYTDDAVVRHGLVHEKVTFLPKPYTPLKLVRTVRMVWTRGDPTGTQVKHDRDLYLE